MAQRIKNTAKNDGAAEKVQTVLFDGVKFSSVAMESRKVARRCIINYYKNFVFSLKSLVQR